MATRQTSLKTTLTGAPYVNLQTLDSGNYYNATLSANNAAGYAHSSIISPTQSVFSGDILVATGNSASLFGGAGKDSLVALGNNDYLSAGTGSATLLGTTTILGGSADTLVGNGASSLVGRGANDTFILSTNGDTITSSVSGGTALMQGASGTILTGISNFSLADTMGHGSGVAYINKLVYTGAGGATLYGNNLADTIIGSTIGNNFISAGAGILGDSLVGGAGNDTLQGNGRSTLNGGAGSDVFYVTAKSGATPGDTIQQTGTSGRVFVKGSGIYDLGQSGNSALGISTLQSDGTGYQVSLVGNNNALNGNLIIGTNVTGGKITSPQAPDPPTARRWLPTLRVTTRSSATRVLIPSSRARAVI